MKPKTKNQLFECCLHPVRQSANQSITLAIGASLGSTWSVKYKNSTDSWAREPGEAVENVAQFGVLTWLWLNMQTSWKDSLVFPKPCTVICIVNSNKLMWYTWATHLASTPRTMAPVPWHLLSNPSRTDNSRNDHRWAVGLRILDQISPENPDITSCNSLSRVR